MPGYNATEPQAAARRLRAESGETLWPQRRAGAKGPRCRARAAAHRPTRPTPGPAPAAPLPTAQLQARKGPSAPPSRGQRSRHTDTAPTQLTQPAPGRRSTANESAQRDALRRHRPNVRNSNSRGKSTNQDPLTHRTAQNQPLSNHNTSAQGPGERNPHKSRRGTRAITATRSWKKNKRVGHAESEHTVCKGTTKLLLSLASTNGPTSLHSPGEPPTSAHDLTSTEQRTDPAVHVGFH